MKCIRAGFQIGIMAVLGFFLTGCDTIPSRLYTSNTLEHDVHDRIPPCDTFLYGQHPIVIIQGFRHASQPALDILKDGHQVYHQPVTLHTGDVMKTTFSADSPAPTYAYAPFGTVTYIINSGVTFDLGKVDPGTYDLKFTTNDIVAATAQFTVVLPAWIEMRRQELQADREQLLQATNQLAQLKAQLANEPSGLTANDPKANALMMQYNALVQDTQARKNVYEQNVQEYNRLVNRLNATPIYHPLRPTVTNGDGNVGP